MTTAELCAIYQFSVVGLALTCSDARITDTCLKIVPGQSAGAFRLTVIFNGKPQAQAEVLADRIAVEFYQRLL